MSDEADERPALGMPRWRLRLDSRELLPLAGLLLVYFLLAHLYNGRVPLGQGVDELGHLGYVQWLADGRGLPVLGHAEGPRAPVYEAHQPPLYYLLCVPVYVVASALGPDEAGLALRLFTACLGALAILCCYGLLKVLWPDRPVARWCGSAFMALLPSNVSLLSNVNNDALMELTGAAFLLLAALSIRGRLTQPGMLLGAVAGLGIWVKSSCLVLWVVGPLALLLSVPARERPGGAVERSPDDAWRQCGLFLLVALVVSAPWLLRNQAVYGDPLGWEAFVRYFHNPPPPAKPYPTPAFFQGTLSLAQYWELVGIYFLSTFLGILTDVRGRPLSMEPQAYSVFASFLVAALGGFFTTRRAWHKPQVRRTVGVAALALVLILAAYLRLNTTFFWAQARYVYLALPAIALVWGEGLTAPFPERYRGLSAGLATAFLLSMNFGLLYGPVAPGLFIR
ncbi:MAG TPA: glycosyltransferase family 39 protein [Armatimonadota bacterium]